MKKYLTCLIAFLPLAGLSAVNIENKELNLDSVFRFRLQNRYTFETQDTENLSGKVSDLSIRRVRFRFEGTVWDPRLLFKFQVGLSDQDMGDDKNIIRDAVAGWRFTPKTTLWVGQTKLPSNRQYMISSGDLSLVDRSIVSAEFNLERDQGAQLHHEFFEETPLRVRLAVTNGEGRNKQNEDSGMSYTGRLDYLPFGHFKDNGDFFEGDFAHELKPKLSIGTVYNSMKRVHREGGTSGNEIFQDGVDLETMIFDYIFKYQGISWSGEYIKRWSNADSAITGEGFTTQIGKMLENQFEPAVRFSKLTGDVQLQQTTAGLSKYINKHRIKLQSDVSYSEGPGRSYWTYRLQFDLGI